MEWGGLEKDTALDVFDVLRTDEDALESIFSVQVIYWRRSDTHDSVQNSRPALVLVFLHGLEEHFFVFGDRHLLVDKKLVAGLVVWLEGKAFRECRVHGIDINVHCFPH